MYLSYSGYALLIDCLRAYYFQYILKPVLTKPDNRVHMLYGDVVGKIFEAFYTEALWKNNTTSSMLDRVKPTLQKVITNETKRGGTFDWKDPDLKKNGPHSIQEVEADIREAIPRGLRSVRHHRLLSLDAKAEVVLDSMVDGHKLAGRADLVMKRLKPTNDAIIIDGKGSRWRDKYTNHRQLRWYALLHWIKFGFIPDKLGFLYWRFEPEESLDWSTVTPEALTELKIAALEAIATVEKANRDILQGAEPFAVFPASPGQGCKLCRYRELCPEGQRALSQAAKDEMKSDMLRGVEDGEVSF